MQCRLDQPFPTLLHSILKNESLHRFMIDIGRVCIYFVLGCLLLLFCNPFVQDFNLSSMWATVHHWNFTAQQGPDLNMHCISLQQSIGLIIAPLHKSELEYTLNWLNPQKRNFYQGYTVKHFVISSASILWWSDSGLNLNIGRDCKIIAPLH